MAKTRGRPTLYDKAMPLIGVRQTPVEREAFEALIAKALQDGWNTQTDGTPTGAIAQRAVNICRQMLLRGEPILTVPKAFAITWHFRVPPDMVFLSEYWLEERKHGRALDREPELIDLARKLATSKSNALRVAIWTYACQEMPRFRQFAIPMKLQTPLVATEPEKAYIPTGWTFTDAGGFGWWRETPNGGAAFVVDAEPYHWAAAWKDVRAMGKSDIGLADAIDQAERAMGLHAGRRAKQ